MSAALGLRLATGDELRAIFAKVHEFWGRGQEIEAYVAQRVSSPQHRRARWYVATQGETIVTSLGSYPVEFYRKGAIVAGIAIGSVHTRPEYRGQGTAPKLLGHVERVERERGAALSVLYSDIAPAYYARLGYQRCPALCGWSGEREQAGSDAGGWQLVAFDGERALSEMMSFYERDHGGRSLAVARDEDYWRHLFPKRPEDRFFWIQEADGTRRGYVRVEAAGSSLKMTDVSVPGASDLEMEQAYRGVLKWGAEQACERIGGWLPDTRGARRCFSVEMREREITMVKVLDGGEELSADEIRAAGHFQEIDHV